MDIIFDKSIYTIVEKNDTYTRFDRDRGHLFQSIQYFFSKETGALRDDLCDSKAELSKWSDLIVAYEVKPTFKYIFELIKIDAELPWVGEMINWCNENLEQYNYIQGKVIKRRFGGMSRSYPIIETPNETDAMAFKLKWL